jgi:predicted dehydrogenase
MAAVGTGVAVSKMSAQTLGANERLGVGFIGVGGRGSEHVNTVASLAEAEKLKLVAVCDAYKPRMQAHADKLKMKPYRRHAELLADKNVDLVMIASSDRNHLPQALDAIRAGKDIYCEKPMGHWTQLELSRTFFEETRKLGRVVQIGNQGNSNPLWKKLGDIIRSGAIGTPQLVQLGFFRNGDWGERMTIPDPNAKPGDDLDWDAFLGDAPKVPFTVDRFFSWRKYLDYSGGPCTDLFPHVYTPFVSALSLGVPEYTVATGGIFKYTTYDREVPDTFSMSMDFNTPNKCSVNIACTLANDYLPPPTIHGDKGTITLQNVKWQVGADEITITPLGGGKPKTIAGSKTESTRDHWLDFLHCVRSRGKPVADVEFGYRVQVALCAAVLSWMKRKVARYDNEHNNLVLG